MAFFSKTVNIKVKSYSDMHKLADMLKENVVIRGFEEGLKEGVDIECSVCLLGKEGLDAIITPNEECEVFNLKELCKDLFD